MSEDPLKDCPNCGKPSLKRLVGGGIGIIFKGSGFYVTDSKNGKKSASTSPEKKNGSDSSTGSDSGAGSEAASSSKETSSDSKSKAKPEGTSSKKSA
jgi:predicted nucleic acid-binding Zn ribbon protein